MFQGYNNLLRDIFEEASLLKSQKVRVIKQPEVVASSVPPSTLQKCYEVCAYRD